MSQTTTASALRGQMRRVRHKLLATMVVLGLVGVIAAYGTWSAFFSYTQNTGNTFAAGTVAIGDNDANGAMFSLTGLTPGDEDEACIEVTYTGSLPANVRLYGTTGGTGLADYINLTVTRGSLDNAAFDDCSDFTPDATNYIGAGNGVVYSGTLTDFADNWNSGLEDAPGATEEWTNGEKHAYRFHVSLQNDNDAQGLTATQVFTWEARNV